MSGLNEFLCTLYEHASQDTNVEHRSFPNTSGEGRPARLMSRDFAEIETFLFRNDKAGRGVFFGVCTRKPGAVQGRREDLAEAVAVWADIDAETAGLDKDTVRCALEACFMPPTAIVDSGRGLHAYWRLLEPVTVDPEAEGGMEAGHAVEAVNRQLAGVFAGDTASVDLARVMRTPGTHNTKDDAMRPVSVLTMNGAEYELEDLADWLSWQAPVLTAPEGRAAATKNFFETYGATYGGDMKPPMDVSEVLDAMTYQGGGETGVHQTQLRVSMSLIGKGWAEDDIVTLILEKTAAAAGDAGRFWNWNAEERRVREMIASGRVKIGDSVRNIQDSKAELEHEAVDPHWSDRLNRDGHKNIKPTAWNLYLMLTHVTDLAGCFALNQWSDRIMASADLPWREIAGDLLDGDEIKLRLYLAERFKIDFPATTTHDVVIAVAGDNAFNPVLDYLNALKWDGVHRIDHWLTRVFGAESDDYTSAVGRKFLIAAVARAMRPGCKVDDVMILEGAQGIGKSSGMRDLMPFDGLFSDAHFDMTRNRESGEALQGFWLVEMSELSVLRTAAAVERVKGFVSTQVDHYRPAYGRNTKAYPRMCTFVGTTNETQYLRDISGNRRFLPIETFHVDRNLIRSIRDQLWAEAVTAFKDGENWWIEDPAVLTKATVLRQSREESSMWDEYVAHYIGHNPARDENGKIKPFEDWAPRGQDLKEIAIGQFMRDIKGTHDAARTHPFETRLVKGALLRLGWSEHRPARDGKQVRIWQRGLEGKIQYTLEEGAHNGNPKKRF